MDRFVQSRARIEVFTKEMFFLLGLILLLALSALNTGNNMIYILVSFLAALIPVSYIQARWSLKKLDARIDFPEEIFAGRPCSAALTLRNGASWRPVLFLKIIVEGMPGERAIEVPFIPPGGTVSKSIPLSFPRRGKHPVRVRLQCESMTGILRVSPAEALSGEVLVFPHLYPFRMRGSGEEAWHEAEAGDVRGGAEGEDLYNIREYTGSEDARFIDWKISAKRRKMMVREYAAGSPLSVVLIVNPLVEDLSFEREMEEIIAKAASAGVYIAGEGLPFGWITPGGRSPLATGRRHLRNFLTSLALLEIEEIEKTGRGGAQSGDRLTGPAKGPALIFTREGIRAVNFPRAPELSFSGATVGR